MPAFLTRLRCLAVLALCGLVFAACDPQHIAELEEGVATEADVRARFGEPVARYDEADGAYTLEYPRQPEGQRNYMITIGTDGKMSALRQVLKPEEFAKVQPGLDRAAVRRLLGRPAATQVYALKQQEVWDWRYLADQESMLFSVVFDAEGRVVEAASRLDPARSHAGG
jgi:outer membrane protein assembly factor BamE (lipoprotein component of BamABCDE complex)